jgi:UDP-N-acetylglucosamine 2-epimerase (non-hydrolysing)
MIKVLSIIDTRPEAIKMTPVIQEEASSLRVPVLVMRDVTEWPEGVEAGAKRLVGTGKDRILEETRRLFNI